MHEERTIRPRITLPDEGLVVGPGDGQELLPGRWWLPLRAADTPGGAALLEMVLPPGTRAPRSHLHHGTDEVWYVLDGRLTLRVGARHVEASAGTCVVVPRGVVHTLHNATEEAVRYLLLLTLGRMMEGYFAELGALIAATPAGPPDPVEWAAIAARYDTEFRDLPPVAP